MDQLIPLCSSTCKTLTSPFLERWGTPEAHYNDRFLRFISMTQYLGPLYVKRNKTLNENPNHASDNSRDTDESSSVGFGTDSASDSGKLDQEDAGWLESASSAKSCRASVQDASKYVFGQTDFPKANFLRRRFFSLQNMIKFLLKVLLFRFSDFFPSKFFFPLLANDTTKGEPSFVFSLHNGNEKKTFFLDSP